MDLARDVVFAPAVLTRENSIGDERFALKIPRTAGAPSSAGGAKLLFSEPAHAEPSKRVWEFDAKCVPENQKHDAVKQQQKESDDGDTEQTRKKAANTAPASSSN